MKPDWKRWFTIQVRKLGGPEDDCFSGTVLLKGQPAWSTVASTEEQAQKDAEFRAKQYAKMVRACREIDEVQLRTPGAGVLNRKNS